VRGRQDFKTLWSVCIFIALSAATMSGQEAAVVVRDAWVRVPSPSKTETALYMVIENHSSQKRSLVAAASDAAAKIEMHQMRMEGRVMIMNPVPQIAIPPGGKATLSPNGLHMMLFGLKNRPAAGDNLNVTLKLDDGTTVAVTAAVRK
jgi:periplasmic copper chaperone A